MASDFSFQNPYRSLSLEEAKGLLDEVIAVASEEELALHAQEMKKNAGNSLQEIVSKLMPIAERVFSSVIAGYGYEGTQMGVIQFMMGIREHSSNAEVRKRTSLLARYLLPVEVVLSAEAMGPMWSSIPSMES